MRNGVSRRLLAAAVGEADHPGGGVRAGGEHSAQDECQGHDRRQSADRAVTDAVTVFWHALTYPLQRDEHSEPHIRGSPGLTARAVRFGFRTAPGRYGLRMEVDWNRELVDQLEWHWRHQLRPRLDGLTDEEYFWQPVPDCWTISRRGASSAPMSFGAGEFTMDFGEPLDREPVTTIAWRLGHLIVGFAETNGTHFGGPPTHVSTFSYAGNANEALRQLDDTYDTWVKGVRGLGAAGLGRPQGPTQPPEFADAPMAKLILYTNLEVIHHGAEICLLRDLYLRNGAQRNSPGPAGLRELTRPARLSCFTAARSPDPLPAAGTGVCSRAGTAGGSPGPQLPSPRTRRRH